MSCVQGHWGWQRQVLQPQLPSEGRDRWHLLRGTLCSSCLQVTVHPPLHISSSISLKINFMPAFNQSDGAVPALCSCPPVWSGLALRRQVLRTPWHTFSSATQPEYSYKILIYDTATLPNNILIYDATFTGLAVSIWPSRAMESALSSWKGNKLFPPWLEVNFK